MGKKINKGTWTQVVLQTMNNKSISRNKTQLSYKEKSQHIKKQHNCITVRIMMIP